MTGLIEAKKQELLKKIELVLKTILIDVASKGIEGRELQWFHYLPEIDLALTEMAETVVEAYEQALDKKMGGVNAYSPFWFSMKSIRDNLLPTPQTEECNCANKRIDCLSCANGQHDSHCEPKKENKDA